MQFHANILLHPRIRISASMGRYVMDRDIGTTGGLGGLYGVLHAIGRGLPFPEVSGSAPLMCPLQPFVVSLDDAIRIVLRTPG